MIAHDSQHIRNRVKNFLKAKIFFACLLIAPIFAGCSFDENIVKECGNEHPNSTWGQFLCQQKKERVASELQKQARLLQEAERRKECWLNFINSDFPKKANDIHKIVTEYFDKDINFISNKLTGELGLSIRNKNIQTRIGDSLVNSTEFTYASSCNLKNLLGITTIDHDRSGNIISMKIHSEWVNKNQEKSKKELENFTYPKAGDPAARNKRILGKYFNLIPELEKRLGKYDSKEGCFYFSHEDATVKRNQIQLSNPLNDPAVWPNDERYCLVIDNLLARNQGAAEEINILLVGNAQGAGRIYPGVVSAHTFRVRSGEIDEQFHSIHPIGEFRSAPKNWKPAEFSKSGPVGWTNKWETCAQGCLDVVNFLIPHKRKFWATQFKASSWDGAQDHDKNFFSITYKILDRDSPDNNYPIRLDLTGKQDGKAIKKSISINFDLIRNEYEIPINFYPTPKN
jgi:hypothetical protein